LEAAPYSLDGVPDPLGHAEPLPLEESCFPLGFPLVLRTNSEEVVAAVRDAWGEMPAAFEETPIELRVVVRPDGGRSLRNPSRGPVFRAQGHLLALVLDANNFAVCDLERCFGFATLSPAVARNHLFLSFHFLDAMAYVCLGQRYATTIHAACVARDGKGILLVGGPGAGKSSLAWACARAGLSYVSDDATWLLRNGREPAVIGKPQRFRFRPQAVRLFPELAKIPRIPSVAGKRSFEIRTAEISGLSTAARCVPWKLLFLDRQGSGPAELSPVSPPETRLRLARVRPLYERRVWEQQEASLEHLVACEAQILRYSRLSDAVTEILKLA